MEHITNAKRERLGVKYSKNTSREGRHSLFHHLLDSDMPESELSDERLTKEAQILLAGGTVSTAQIIVHISYYILARTEIRTKLQRELQDVMAAWPQRVPTLDEFEKLPYLQALIKEGLRYVEREPRWSDVYVLTLCFVQSWLRRHHAQTTTLLSRCSNSIQAMVDSYWGKRSSHFEQ